MSFESQEAAIMRREQENMAPETKRRKKDHVGSSQNVTWDKQGLKQEVEGYEDGKAVNWSALAKKYNVTNQNGEMAGNGGQIIKEFLQSEGVNVNRLKRPHEYKGEEKRVRRKKLRGKGGIV